KSTAGGCSTVTLVMPETPGGVRVSSKLSDRTCVSSGRAGTPPNTTTFAAREKPAPDTVTTVPPAMPPRDGRTPKRRRGASYKNPSASTPRSAPRRTTTSTGPAGPEGNVAVIVVSFTTTMSVAARLAKVTAVAPVKPRPVSVTSTPPTVEAVSGATLS